MYDLRTWIFPFITIKIRMNKYAELNYFFPKNYNVGELRISRISRAMQIFIEYYYLNP